MAELMFMIAKDKTTETARSVKPKGGVNPHASPIMREPRFGRRNSALETMPNKLIVSNMLFPQHPTESRQLNASVIFMFYYLGTPHLKLGENTHVFTSSTMESAELMHSNITISLARRICAQSS
jgi:hypothetical protein